MIRILHWFRRDLRLNDNAAFSAAAHDSAGMVLPLFILDDALLQGRFASAARSTWLLAGLRALDAELRARGSRLIVRRGDPQQILPALAAELDAAGVYWNRDYTPYAIKRDSTIKAQLKADGRSARSFKDGVIFEMDDVLSGGGTAYTVYTPYARTWRKQLTPADYALQTVPELGAPAQWPASDPIPEPSELGLDVTHPLPAAGEQAALASLAQFLDLRRNQGIADYAEQRNLPGSPGTSRLSPYLRLGMLGIRTCLRAALERADANPQTPQNTRDSIDTWVSELIWRDFYVQVLYHHPHVLSGAFRQEYDRLDWPNDEGLFAAWQAGRTGYPIVDAAMRQLRREGWMHNRARMIVASFLTKDLLVDWRWGERHFMQLLIDGDPAANNGGWQWAAGTGTDAQPYFRIFNPVSQGKKFDPEGAYVRRYVPELANVPNKFIHEPHTMAPAEQIRADVQVGRDYPAPIVDHKQQRERALALYARVKK
ncbi:MAG: deoxyribodipyrimidine photo-lyase [Oscillochloris sp.]|nr:deoxyribodipyrimidine photo-lyase [Oscillochloris sp.]